MSVTRASGSSGKRLVILGGGLSGLSFLHYFRNFAAYFNKTDIVSKAIVVEANNYMGGSIKSNLYEDGVVFELGPRSVRTQGVRGKNTVALLEQLGLQDKLVTIKTSAAAAQSRYIYDGKLYPLDLIPRKIFSKLPNSSKTLAGCLLNDFRAERIDLNEYPHKDPSLYDFIAHRFGIEAAEKIIDPIMRGISAGDARNLSTKAMFAEVLDKEQAYGGITKSINKPPITKMPHDDLFPNDVLESKLLDQFEKDDVLSYNLTTGLQTLPEYLSNSLLNTNDDGLIDIYNQTQVKSIELARSKLQDEPQCKVTVQTVDGDLVTIDADHIVSTIPSSQFAKVLPESMPVEQRNALESITKIPHVPVGCVCVEYRGVKRLPKEVNSFGFVSNSKSDSRVLGIAFDSTMFPKIGDGLNSTRMTCMIGGAWFKDVVGTDNLDDVTDSKLEQIALEEIRRILKIEDEPFRVATLLWKTGIAQYTPGHKDRLEKTRESLRELSLPLTLLGQSYDGIAVNDVVFSARMAAFNFVKSL